MSFHNVAVRSTTGLILTMALYCLVWHVGHTGLAASIMFVSAIIFNELVALRQKTVSYRVWVWFWIGMVMSYSKEDMIDMAVRVRLPLPVVWSIDTFRDEVVIASIGSLLVWVVCDLERSCTRSDVSTLAHIFMATAVSIVPFRCFVSNVHAGLIYVAYPTAIVAFNDATAYFFGKLCGGRFTSRPFFPSLSPNKTWEGFVGGGVATILFGMYISSFTPHPWLACPYESLRTYGVEACVAPDYLVGRQVSRMSADVDALDRVVDVAQLRGTLFAIFAGTIAPFGGLLASGFKRAYKVKDFGSAFPGHGGFVDRLDCQLVAACFVWAYLRLIG